MSELQPVEDRRQRARVEYYDDCSRRRDAVEGDAIALDAAIEVATQVKITDDIINSAWGMIDPREMARVMFTAAGFEVVE